MVQNHLSSFLRGVWFIKLKLCAALHTPSLLDLTFNIDFLFVFGFLLSLNIILVKFYKWDPMCFYPKEYYYSLRKKSQEIPEKVHIKSLLFHCKWNSRSQLFNWIFIFHIFYLVHCSSVAVNKGLFTQNPSCLSTKTNKVFWFQASSIHRIPKMHKMYLPKCRILSA